MELYRLILGVHCSGAKHQLYNYIVRQKDQYSYSSRAVTKNHNRTVTHRTTTQILQKAS